jgi:2-amino-4-hydroxy-6-hydroxymethyldihydropteridine diphosphokinase
MRNGALAAYIGIGSNVGDRARNCYSAVQQLTLNPDITITRMSPLIETAPVGGPPGTAPYLNGAIQIETHLGSHALLHELLTVEKNLGRIRVEKDEPRTIDLDLLLYADKIVSSDELMIPHPMMHQRRFVLEPLAIIAPDAIHPTLQMTVKGMLDNLE